MMNDDVEILRNDQGWLITSHGVRKGPYIFLNQLENDVESIVSTLSITKEDLVKKLLKIKLTIGESVTTPAEMVFGNDYITIVPDLHNGFRIVHPAIDYIDDLTLIGVWLPCIITTHPKKEGQVEKKTTEYRLFFISSKREFTLASEEEMTKHKWLFVQDPFPFQPQPRWQPDRYLEDELPTTPAETYQAIYNEVSRYMDFNDMRHFVLVTLYFMATYFFHIFICFPYLYIGGTKRSGKTKLLTFAKQICFNAEFSTSITDASLFRIIQNSRATLLIDENEKLQDSERASSFRALLLGGFMSDSYAHRVEESPSKKRKPLGFELYSPKIIANISGIEDVLADRCISLTLLRGLDQNKLRLWPDSKAQVWLDIRNRLYALALSDAVTICAISSTCDAILEENNIHSRQKLLWLPILTMAKLVDGKERIELTNAILSLAKEVEENRDVQDVAENVDVSLIEVLKRLCLKDDYYYIKDIKEKLVEEIGEEKKGKDGSISFDPPRWLNNLWVGRALRRLGFQEGHRVGGGPRQIRITPTRVENLARRLITKTIDAETTDTNDTNGTNGITATSIHNEQNTSERTETNQEPTYPSSSQKPCIQDILLQLKVLVPKSFVENDFIENAIKLGLQEKESGELFRKLVDDGKILRDPDGFWSWQL